MCLLWVCNFSVALIQQRRDRTANISRPANWYYLDTSRAKISPRCANQENRARYFPTPQVIFFIKVRFRTGRFRRRIIKRAGRVARWMRKKGPRFKSRRRHFALRTASANSTCAFREMGRFSTFSKDMKIALFHFCRFYHPG